MTAPFPVRHGTAAAAEGCAVVFADSAAALALARQRGAVPANAVICTFSPALAGHEGIRPADAHVTPQRIRALEQAMLQGSLALHRAFAETPDEALVLARACIAELPLLAYHALALDEEVLRRDPAVVVVGFQDADRAAMYGAPLAEIAGENRLLRRIDILPDDLPPAPAPIPGPAPLAMRLGTATLPSVGYRLAQRFWSRFGRSGARGSILVVRENELVKETAFALARKGFAIHMLDYPAIAEAEARAAAPVLAGRVRAPMGEILSGVLAPRLADLVAKLLAERAELAVGRFRVLRQRLTRSLEEAGRLRPRAVLSNVKFEPEAVAIRAAARAQRLPAFFFAHGFAAELSAREADYYPRHENVLGDVAFVFNDDARERLAANPLKAGETVAVGLPREHLLKHRARRRKDAPPVWYISTGLYNGAMPALCRGVTDHVIAETETGIVREVLAKLPHRVLYKPYPASRFLDPDPVVECVRTQPNIELHERRIDLRHIVGDARVLVTSRATSTVCWCLMSERPTIFIDYPDQLPLSVGARQAFEAGALLIAADGPGWMDSLREVLSQPIEGIEALWRQKAAARRCLIESYFTSHLDGGAGRRAAGHILRHLRDTEARR